MLQLQEKMRVKIDFALNQPSSIFQINRIPFDPYYQEQGLEREVMDIFENDDPTFTHCVLLYVRYLLFTKIINNSSK